MQTLSLFLTNESNNKHSKATTHLDTFEFALGECVVNRVTKERYRVVQRVDEENVEVRDFTGETLRVKSSELRSAKEFGSVFFRTFRPEFVKKWRTLYSPSHESTSLNEEFEEEKEEDVAAIYGYDVEQDLDLNDEFQKNGLPLSPDAFSGFSKGSTWCSNVGYHENVNLYHSLILEHHARTQVQTVSYTMPVFMLQLCIYSRI
jgi:hypothetical protein